jgi:hypothetical protein
LIDECSLCEEENAWGPSLPQRYIYRQLELTEGTTVDRLGAPDVAMCPVPAAVLASEVPMVNQTSLTLFKVKP